MAKQFQSTPSGSGPPHPRKWAAEEPMTAVQRSELEKLTQAAGEDFDPEAILTKAEAQLQIDELLRAAKRGQGGGTVED
jgi:hypothetical protein